MKKQNVTKKLKFVKTTISNLNTDELSILHGGISRFTKSDTNEDECNPEDPIG